MRYNLKKLYFNGVPADKVRTTSPLKSMTDDQWRELVEMWSSPKHKVCRSEAIYFLALVCGMFVFISTHCTPI
jgi:hypothetical protein